MLGLGSGLGLGFGFGFGLGRGRGRGRLANPNPNPNPHQARVRAGATVPLLAAHNGAEMAFTLEEDKLTRKGNECELLAHPRFDPRWLGLRVGVGLGLG